MSRGPSPSPGSYLQPPAPAPGPMSYPVPQPTYQNQSTPNHPSHLSPCASSLPQPSYPSAQMQTHHPSIPPRSALRVNTEFAAGRIRSNSSAIPGPARPSARPADLQPVYGAMNHQFTRSLSHASPLSPVVSSLSPVGGAERDGRDVFMAVRNLRGMAGGDDPETTSPTMSMSGPSIHSFARSNSEVIGQFSDAHPSERMMEEEGEETDTLEKLRTALNKSNDGGNTLDLSRRGIRQIGPLAVEVFRKGVGQEHRGVWRLALSYNSLRDDGIDFSFSRLGRLRYLNLKGNSFTVFPIALTEMPALEILDLSKNRLTCFPDRPGRLIYLKVLSLTNNKIITLPSYLTQFEALKVFKVDNNPIEWPPREVLGDLVNGDTSREREEGGAREQKREEDLRPWIENMKSWMRQKEANSDRVLQRNEGDVSSRVDSVRSGPADDSYIGDTDYSPDSPTTRVTSQQTIRQFRPDVAGRSASPASTAVSSRTSRPSLGNRSRSTTLSNDNLARSGSPPKPAPLQTSNLHTRQRSSTSPPISALSMSSTQSHSRQSAANLPLPTPPAIPAVAGHNRGASYTATQRLSTSLASKKSLPDLRQSHAKIIQERRDSGHEVIEIRPLTVGINTPSSASFNAPSPSPSVGPKTESSKSPVPISLADQGKSRALNRKGSADMLRRFKGGMAPDSPVGLSMGDKRNSTEGPLVDDSRNSYFRRLSTLPVSSISKAIPPSLLRCVDAIRGILFALSQLHSALRQYLVFAVSDRVASLFSKVMDPASGRMTALINALDRFDSMSRRGTPPVSAIRGVMECTRDSIVTFAKVVAVFRLQMPAVKGTDVRYTRTLLLMIYGSMAEVSYSWMAMAPLMAEIKALLGDPQGVAMRAILGLGGTKMSISASFSGRTPISPIPERGETSSPPSAPRSERTEKAMGNSPLHQSVSAVENNQSPTPAVAAAVVARGAGAKSRRQAGSFSTQDVQRGMKMGVNESPIADTQRTAAWGRHKSSGSGNSLLPRTTEEMDMEEEESRLSALEEDELDTMLPNPPFALRAGVSNSSTTTTIPTPQTPPEHSAPLQPVSMAPTASQTSRRGHHGPSSSSGSSHALQYGNGSGGGIPRKLSVDIRPPTPASATAQIDEDLLDVIESATDVAFTAWLRLAEDIGASSPPANTAGHSKTASQSSLSSGPYSANDSRRPPTISPKHYSELLDLLSSSEQVTSTLRESLMAIRANPYSPSQYSHLHANAQMFVKAVVKVTELVMKISATHTFPSGVKSCCARLVQFTREFAILFSVSNMRPGTSASMRSLSTAATGGAGGQVPMSARSTSPMPFSGRSMGGSGSGVGWSRSGSGSGSGSGSVMGFAPAPLSARSGSMGYIPRENGGGRAYGYRVGTGAESSNEDLLVPHSAITPGSGGWNGSNASHGQEQGYGQGMNGPPSAGLRGLQLPSRQAALAKRRAGAGAGAVPVR